MIAKTLLKLNRTGRRAVQVKRFNPVKLNVPEIRRQFHLQLKTGMNVAKIDKRKRAK